MQARNVRRKLIFPCEPRPPPQLTPRVRAKEDKGVWGEPGDAVRWKPCKAPSWCHKGGRREWRVRGTRERVTLAEKGDLREYEWGLAVAKAELGLRREQRTSAAAEEETVVVVAAAETPRGGLAHRGRLPWPGLRGFVGTCSCLLHCRFLLGKAARKGRCSNPRFLFLCSKVKCNLI